MLPLAAGMIGAQPSYPTQPPESTLSGCSSLPKTAAAFAEKKGRQYMALALTAKFGNNFSTNLSSRKAQRLAHTLE